MRDPRTIRRRANARHSRPTMTVPKAKITALGCYVPPRVLTNQDREKIVETNDERIVSRNGIRERHIAAPEMATSDIAIHAAPCALAQRGVPAPDATPSLP